MELGIALATGKRIYIYSPDEKVHDLETATTFYYLPQVYMFVGSLDAFVTQLLLLEGAVQA